MIPLWFVLAALLLAALPRGTADSEPRREEGEGVGHGHPLRALLANLDNSWLDHLSPETSTNRLKSRNVANNAAAAAANSRRADDGTSNNVPRPVYNGHYVSPVSTDPLLSPRLVIYAPDVAASLGLDGRAVRSPEFVRLVSGDVGSALAGWDDASDASDRNNATATAAANILTTWATPYALSIMGRRYVSNCPYGTGVGYGDGRATSIGEFKLVGGGGGGAPRADLVDRERDLPPPPDRYELQLKGSGPTPFSRGSDGRAVLRSSIREFLASEAMHRLGVPTTRALSLVVSGGSTVRRPWYSDGSRVQARGTDGGRFDAAARDRADPDVLITEPCAITCRASPSFVRVGHLDLFARRVERSGGGGGAGGTSSPYETTTREWSELVQMVWHAAYRDFPTRCYRPHRPANDTASVARCLLRGSLSALSSTVANWIRVGYVQGNFNADNCLVSGRTVDYGPFGFVDEYHPLYAKWTGSGDHFGFMNQPEAGLTNFGVLVESVMPLIEVQEGKEEADRFRKQIESEARDEFRRKLREVFRIKLGFAPEDERGDGIWERLEPLLRGARADWTLFWRQLYVVARDFPIMADGEPSEAYAEMLRVLCADEDAKEGSSPFYVPLDDGHRSKFIDWIREWRTALQAAYQGGDACTSEGPSQPDACMPPEERMRMANPKYIPREYMLVEAYTKASAGRFQPSSIFPSGAGSGVQSDESMIHELYALLQNPYDEGTDEFDRRYYRRAPDEALRAGGTAYMS